MIKELLAMPQFFGKLLSSRAMRWVSAACLLFIVMPRAGLCAGYKDGITHLERAWSHLQRDELEPAAREAASAAALLQGTEGKQRLPEAHEVLAIVELRLGRPAQAADHAHAGLTACGPCEERTRLRFLLTGAYRDLGRYGEAESLLKELVAEAEAAGSAEDQSLGLEGLAIVTAAQGRR
ncbi:MAG TPA: hypothetical protein VEP28_14625, partial [Rubrobacter sp.]|nr:hypothetical protein [Rubrobacter sp.]